MLKTCAMVKACGRRVSKHDAEWYDSDPSTLVKQYFNIGDVFVYDSLLKLLDYDNIEFINIDAPFDPAQAERIRASCRCVILRPSNYIHNFMPWGTFQEWIDALGLPVVCAGVGAQASIAAAFDLSPEQVRLWRSIADRTPSIGVRGAFSAEVLARHGIANVDIVGCPTMFRHLSPAIRLRHRPWSTTSRVAFSTRLHNSSLYTTNPAEYIAQQRALLIKMAAESDVSVAFHEDAEERAYFFRDGTRTREARTQFFKIGWFKDEAGDRVEALYVTSGFFTASAARYDAFIRDVDAALGYRVHSVLPALAAGTPAVLSAYDSRSMELAETFHIPAMTPDALIASAAGEIFRPDRFDRFVQGYGDRYATMRAHLDANGVSHRM